MTDTFGRVIDYIRISVTDRCNLRCVYCMPEEGVCLNRQQDLLRFGELERLCRIFAAQGIKKIKITGGEPLIRKNLPLLLQNIKRIPGIESLTITTNGVLLADQLDGLAAAGVDSINISLDTLHREQYRQLTRFDRFDRVAEGIRRAIASGIRCKINCVPIVQLNEDSLTDLAALARDLPLDVRFIELMPMGFGRYYQGISPEEVKALLQERFGPLTRAEHHKGNGPCAYYSLPGFRGKIGMISAVSDHFCASCNRVRLTAEGYLKSCLHYDIGVDIRQPLREGCSDRELGELFRQAVQMKPLSHDFSLCQPAHADVRSMVQIGG